MMLKSLVLLLIIFMTTVSAVTDIEVCSTNNTDNKFNVTNFIRFQSPNYPSSMFKNINSTCNSAFVPVNDGDYLWFAVINGAFVDALISDNLTNSLFKYDYKSNYDVTTFTATSGILNFQVAYHGYGFPELWSAFDVVILSFSPSFASSCPFSGQIITMDNETIIPISSDFGIFDYASKNCFWTFKNDDPINYQFKVYIKHLTPTVTVTIKNDGTDNSFDYVPLNGPQVLYLNGSELNILLYNIHNNQNSNGFFAIISIVPINANYIEKCQIKTNENGTVLISNVNYENEYDAFSTCTYNITIPTGHEAILDVSEFWAEAGVDKLTVSKDNQSLEIKNTGFFKIQKEFNGSVFKFIADGNIQQAGFSAVYRTIECKCADPNFVIPCGEYSFLYPLPNNSAYCDHQDCNFTISLEQNCTKDYFTIEPSTNLHNAWLTIYINEVLFQNYTNYAPEEILPYPRNTNITVIFHSGQSNSPFFHGIPNWSIGTKAIASPKITNKILLNSTSPTYAVFLDSVDADQAFTVCSPNDDVLELFIANGMYMSAFDLYDSDGLNNFVATLEHSSFNTTSQGISKIISKSGCFSIYCSEKSPYILGTVLFRMQKAHTKNCNTEQNIVRLLQNRPTSYTINATNDGSCEMIIFAEEFSFNPMLLLNDFETSSFNTTFSFSSGLNGNPYFDLSSNETNLWKQTLLYTPMLSILAPAAFNLVLNISSASSYYTKEENEDRKGVILSPLYSGTNLTFFNERTQYRFDLNGTKSVNFVVRNLSPVARVTLQNTVTDEYHTFVANENYLTNCSTFYVYGNDAFRIEYGFNVLINDQITTTSTVSSSTSPITPFTTSTLNPLTPPSTTSTLPSTPPVTTASLEQLTSTITTSSSTETTIHKNDGMISSYHFIVLFVTLVLVYSNLLAVFFQFN